MPRTVPLSCASAQGQSDRGPLQFQGAMCASDVFERVFIGFVVGFNIERARERERREREREEGERERER